MRKVDRDRPARRIRWQWRWRWAVGWTALVGIALLSIAACSRTQEQEQVPAAALAPVPRDQPLDSTLAMLENELALALGGEGGDDEVNHSLMRAEAISDRLLESRMPFDWLTGSSYSVEARLRQIQSLADRVVAQVRARGPRDRMLADASDLRRQVVQLRTAIAQGGGPAPTPLEDLLHRRDSTFGRATPAPTPPAQPPTRRPAQPPARRDTSRGGGGGPRAHAQGVTPHSPAA